MEEEKKQAPTDYQEALRQTIGAFYEPATERDMNPVYKTTRELLTMLSDHLAEQVDPMALRNALTDLNFRVVHLNDKFYWCMRAR